VVDSCPCKYMSLGLIMWKKQIVQIHLSY
jgi:hypothetical protein